MNVEETKENKKKKQEETRMHIATRCTTCKRRNYYIGQETNPHSNI